MTKFTINSKELKKIVEKIATIVNDKNVLPVFGQICFTVKDKKLVCRGANLDHWLEVRSDNAWDTEDGMVCVDIENLKPVLKMEGNIVFMQTDEEHITVKCGKKSISTMAHPVYDIKWNFIDEQEKKVTFTAKENWMLETMTNLSVSAMKDDNQPVFQTVHFNAKERKAEASDGSCLTQRMYSDNVVIVNDKNVLIKIETVPVLKKIMDKKSENIVTVCCDDKWITMYGNDFTYTSRLTEGVYMETYKFWEETGSFSFDTNREDMERIAKYNWDMTKKEMKVKGAIPMTFHAEDGKMYVYQHTNKFDILDELPVENLKSKDDYTFVNPRYIMEAMTMADSDIIHVSGGGIRPIIMFAKEYSFLVMPVRTDVYKVSSVMYNAINNYKAS